jgi:AcrR family transcriptional regulator
LRVLKPTALLDLRSRPAGDSDRGSPYRKLRPGPGRNAEEVISNQLARLRAAMVDLVAERGIAGVTIRGLASTAGVSTRTFYAHFPNAEECFTSTYDTVMRTALERFTGSRMTEDDWEAAVRSGLHALMVEIAEHPPAAALALVEAFEAGPAMLREMGSKMREFERSVLDTLGQAPNRVEMPLPVVQGIAAGVERVVRTKVMEGRNAELPEISDELADWALAMHDSAVERLPDPAAGAASGERRSRRRHGDRELGTTEFGALGDERARILGAVARLSLTDGYWNLTVPKIRREAAVSRSCFDSHFEDVDSCYLAAVEALSDGAGLRAERKAEGAPSWERGVCRMVLAYCSEVARTPALAQLAFLEVFAPGHEGLKCRERRIAFAAERLRRVAGRGEELSPLAAEASAGAAWRMIQAEVADGRSRTVPRLAPQIAYVTLAPAVGASAAVAAISAELLERRERRRANGNGEALIDERRLTQAAG